MDDKKQKLSWHVFVFVSSSSFDCKQSWFTAAQVGFGVDINTQRMIGPACTYHCLLLSRLTVLRKSKRYHLSLRGSEKVDFRRWICFCLLTLFCVVSSLFLCPSLPASRSHNPSFYEKACVSSWYTAHLAIISVIQQTTSEPKKTSFFFSNLKFLMSV